MKTMKKANQIGPLKSKILSFLIESYSAGNKKEVKRLVSLIRENKDFGDLYLFYDEIENKFFVNESQAKQYIEEIIPLLEDKFAKVSKFVKKLSILLTDVEYETNGIYENLDALLLKKTIHNIDTKLKAKTDLIEHLTTKKEVGFGENINSTTNESFLFATLTNNFNALYENTLDEEQKENFKTILSMSSNDVELEVTTLREEILDKISTLLTENTAPDLATKLETVKSEVGALESSKRNLVKLQQLKDGLD